MPSNAVLEAALDEANTAPSAESRARVCREFLRAWVCIGCREPVNVAGPLPEDLTVPMLTATGPEGKVLLVFTSEEQLRKRSSAAHPVWLRAQTVQKVGERDGLAGVVINPAGVWVFLEKAEIATTPVEVRHRRM